MQEAVTYDLDSLLTDGCAAMDIELSGQTRDQLLQYVGLLARWNRTYNLTAVREPIAMLSRHILDSLTLLPFVEEKARILDVGSGAGLPGLPLAMAKPSLHVSLLDSNRKKICFLRQVTHDCAVKNANVVNRRVEDFTPPQRYDAVVVRAFASLTDIMDKTSHVLTDSGTVLAMKGVCPEVELAALQHPYQVHAVTVPGLDEQRHIIVIQANVEAKT